MTRRAHQLLLAGIALLSLLAIGCASKSSRAAATASDLPSETEARQSADAQINEANADAEFEKLRQEIESDDASGR
jgi:hypothetical protein